ncbi:unnamed protein product [Phytomonas sp. EM1]|nr:unnamed protein product [Phytomonas sp. EM1]|eukprot:CCW60840.1 unnamed protein product [Phytomonas sp. isolate EM1]
MPFDIKEATLHSTQKICKAVQDVRNAVKELGTDRDAIARIKIKRARDIVYQCSQKISPLLRSLEPEFKTLKEQFQLAESSFRTVDLNALRKEKMTYQYEDQPPVADDQNDDDARSLRAYDRCSRPLYLSEFRTEEANQEEKLQNVMEIESDVMDLNVTYQEYHLLLAQQQQGLTTIGSNAGGSNELIAEGHNQLQQSLKYQEARKIRCILMVIFVLIVIGITAVTFCLNL